MAYIRLDHIDEGLSVPFVLLACQSPLCASSSVSHKLGADSSFSELILNEMKTQVITFGSLHRQQALSASLMINTAAGNVLQLVDQFNDRVRQRGESLAGLYCTLTKRVDNTLDAIEHFRKALIDCGHSVADRRHDSSDGRADRFDQTSDRADRLSQ